MYLALSCVFCVLSLILPQKCRRSWFSVLNFYVKSCFDVSFSFSFKTGPTGKGGETLHHTLPTDVASAPGKRLSCQSVIGVHVRPHTILPCEVWKPRDFQFGPPSPRALNVVTERNPVLFPTPPPPARRPSPAAARPPRVSTSLWPWGLDCFPLPTASPRLSSFISERVSERFSFSKLLFIS